MTNPKSARDMTRAHYATLLAPAYRWMVGDISLALSRSRAELASLGIRAAKPGARALDLGAGLGLQSIPLSELGYEVTAIDSSPELLAELGALEPSIRTREGDLCDLDFVASGSYDVVVCMGDTLTHLSSLGAIDALLGKISAVLAADGLLALTFRDYVATRPASGEASVLVRADEQRILTCHLVYERDRVRVTDIVHERNNQAWAVRSSSYFKQAIMLDWLREHLRAHGFSRIECASQSGRSSVVAVR